MGGGGGVLPTIADMKCSIPVDACGLGLETGARAQRLTRTWLSLQIKHIQNAHNDTRM